MIIEQEDPAPRQLRDRLPIVLGIIGLILLVLVGRLWQLQVMRGRSYLARTMSNVVHEKFLPAVRGRITDRSGIPLADNRPAFNLYGPRPQLDAQAQTTLADVLQLTTDEQALIASRIEAAPPHGMLLLLSDVGRDRAALLAQRKLAGIEVRLETKRIYPEGALAAHVLGYLAAPTPSDITQWKDAGVSAETMVGRSGIEAIWEDQLHGHPGRERYAVDARGHRMASSIVAGLIAGDPVTAPDPGADVVLTLDAPLQREAERAVARHAAAAAVVVEVHTGKILALVSKPSFDPNVMTGTISRTDYAALTDDPRRPFLNKATRAVYPPGSVFKFVTAAAALESAHADPAERVTCRGVYELSDRRFRCTHAHGKLDLREAFQHSCNVYFWELAARIGIDQIAAMATQFGFGVAPALRVGADTTGRVPTKAWYESRGKYLVGFATNTSTGQGDVEVSVLQVALAYAALANGGTLYVPQLVERVGDQDAPVMTYSPGVVRTIELAPRTWQILRDGLWAAVNERGGTAFNTATSDRIAIAGKTGTAEVRARPSDGDPIPGWDPKASHAWFAGYAPAADPQIAVVVLVEHGGAGGRFAGPVAKQIVEAWAASR